jgi:methyl coenzyme M reductase subunit C
MQCRASDDREDVVKEKVIQVMRCNLGLHGCLYSQQEKFSSCELEGLLPLARSPGTRHQPVTLTHSPPVSHINLGVLKGAGFGSVVLQPCAYYFYLLRRPTTTKLT